MRTFCQYKKTRKLLNKSTIFLLAKEWRFTVIYLPFNSPCPILPRRPMTTLQGSDVICIIPKHQSQSFCKPILLGEPFRLRALSDKTNHYFNRVKTDQNPLSWKCKDINKDHNHAIKLSTAQISSTQFRHKRDCRCWHLEQKASHWRNLACQATSVDLSDQ